MQELSQYFRFTCKLFHSMQKRRGYCMITKFHGSLLMTFLDLQEKREGHRIGKESKYYFLFLLL